MRPLMKCPNIPFILFICCCLVGLSGFAPAKGSLVDEILENTNALRASRGLQRLSIREELNSIAQRHSVSMAKGRVAFGHDGFNKRSREAEKSLGSLQSFAENVAYGARTAKEVVEMWKKSNDHRRNLLGKFRYTGIGVAEDRKGRLYYTQVFAN